MSPTLLAPLFVAIVALVAIATAGHALMPPSGVHRSAVGCAGCHASHDVARPDATPEAATPAPAFPPEPGCGLLLPGSETATSQSCLACHVRQSHGGHPYDVGHPRSGGGVGARVLRPLDEVTRRGLVLADGQVRCVTCHDRNSPWRYRIKLPPGAKPMPAVDLRRPATYENPETLPAPRPGDDVSRKPLCLVCHLLD